MLLLDDQAIVFSFYSGLDNHPALDSHLDISYNNTYNNIIILRILIILIIIRIIYIYIICIIRNNILVKYIYGPHINENIFYIFRKRPRNIM